MSGPNLRSTSIQRPELLFDIPSMWHLPYPTGISQTTLLAISVHSLDLHGLSLKFGSSFITPCHYMSTQGNSAQSVNFISVYIYAEFFDLRSLSIVGLKSILLFVENEKLSHIDNIIICSFGAQGVV